MEYRAIFYNQPLNSQNIPNSTNENRARRRGTLKALSLIFKNWRRGNSIRPQLLNDNCSIWLGSFENGKMLIQLKWNKQHWFHLKCLEGWAINNSTWPLWRTNYVEMAKKEDQILRKTDNLSIHGISNQERT